MEIHVNNEKLNFTLENESTVLEIIESVEHWLNNQNVVISYINVDGAEITPEKKNELIGISLSDVNNISIETASPSEIALVSLQDSKLYIDTFLEEIDKGRDYFLSDKDEKIEGLKWVSDMIFTSSRVLGISIPNMFYENDSLEETLAFMALSVEQLENKKRDDSFFYDYFATGIREKLVVLKEFIPILIQQAVFQSHHNEGDFNDTNILHVLSTLKTNIYGMASTLEKISESFQSGDDINALIGIKKITGVLDNLVITLKRIEDLLGLDYTKMQVAGKTVHEMNKNLLDIITEIFNAFKDKDTVLLADLIEYELSEYFDYYKDVLETLTIITNQKKMVN